MKNSKKGFANAALLIVVVVAVAAGGYFALRRQTPVPEPTPVPVIEPDTVLNPTPNPSVQSQSPKRIPQAHNAFGFKAIKLLAEEEGDKNVFISNIILLV